MTLVRAHQGLMMRPQDGDPFWANVVLLLDNSKVSTASDAHWANVVLLLDNSKRVMT